MPRHEIDLSGDWFFQQEKRGHASFQTGKTKEKRGHPSFL